MTEIISLAISPSLRAKIDKTRGDIPRSKYVSKILERELDSTRENDLSSNNSKELKPNKIQKSDGDKSE